MEKYIRVALYGSSLLMAGLAVSLKEKPGLEVVHIHPGAPDACQRLNEPGFRVIILDINEPPTDLVLSLFQKHPELSLLALDPAGDRLLALTGETSQPLTIDDLLQVIQHKETFR
ncbi:MAG: hypothetical protein HZB19_03745 [Chloroflexi bacterium]|nr:hypothetical protein [Chloroflexota bacterium]